MSNPRAYHSPIRRKNADETRDRICDAARVLMVERGFDGTTIEAVATAAGVAPQTVYAAFGSKRGIVGELVDRARFGKDYEAQVQLVIEAPDAVTRLRMVAGVARRIFDAERSELDLLRGAAAMSPELAKIGNARENTRYEGQQRLVDMLSRHGALREGLTTTTARDVIWTLTGRDNYRMIVQERGWSPARYEAWLGDLLARAVLADDLVSPPKARAKKTKAKKASKA